MVSLYREISAHIVISVDNIFRKVVKRDMNRCW